MKRKIRENDDYTCDTTKDNSRYRKAVESYTTTLYLVKIHVFAQDITIVVANLNNVLSSVNVVAIVTVSSVLGNNVICFLIFVVIM